MRRLTLLAAVAAVAGAHDAAAAVANAHDAVGEVSFAEARCLLRNRRIAFLGDSNSRFHWMTLAARQPAPPSSTSWSRSCPGRWPRSGHLLR